MGDLKTKENDDNVLEFIHSVDNEQRKEDCLKLLKVFTQVTNETPKMWGASIIGFGSYHYKYESGREGHSFLTGFSPRKQNLTLYIQTGFKGYEEIMKKLGKYKTSSSCLYVKNLSDIDLDSLKILIENSTENMKKKYA